MGSSGVDKLTPPSTRPVGTRATEQRRVPPSLSRVYPALFGSPAALAQGDLVNPWIPVKPERVVTTEIMESA